MEAEPSHRKLLKLTLEFIHLLTGELFPLVMSGDSECLSRSLMPKPINKQRILEVISQIAELLAGEVPVRCQDVAVYLSMEEWEYLEDHRDLYTEAMMEELLPPSPDRSATRNPPEGSPHPPNPQVPSLEDAWNTLHHIMKLEVKEESADMTVRGAEQDMEEEVFSEISRDGRYMEWNNLEEHADGEKEDAITVECTGDSTTPISHVELQPAHLLSLLPTQGLKFPDLSPTVPHHTEQTPPQKTYSCSECGRSFSRRRFLMRHQKSQNCKPEFADKRIHTEDAPYSCLICGKRFPVKSCLVMHERVHAGNWRNTCPVCGKCFPDKSQLARHSTVHTGERPFPCSKCGKSFSRKSVLIIHDRIHTGEKPYSCPKCGKCFTAKATLTNHLSRVHSGQKSYSCF